MSVETSVAQGAATALSVADALAPTALVETGLAMVDIPAAGLCLTQMIKGAALPGGLGAAALKWAETGAKLDEAKQKLKDVTAAVPADAWSSDDREAFNKKVEELGTQLETARVFADAVGTALIVSGGVLAAYGVFIAVIGTELLVQAVMIAVEAASVIGDLGPMEAQEAEANATAVEIASTIEETNATMKTTAQVTAGVLLAAGFVHEVAQKIEGNDNVGTDFLKGSAVALPEIGLSWVLGKAGEKVTGKALGRVFGKDLDKVAEEAGEDAIKAAGKSALAQDASKEAATLAGKAAKAAEEDAAQGVAGAATQRAVADALQHGADTAAEDASKAAEHAAGEAGTAALKGIDGVTHTVVKKTAEHAGEYGGQHAGEAGGSWIDKILNHE